MADGSLRKGLILRSGNKANRLAVQSLSRYKCNEDLRKMAASMICIKDWETLICRNPDLNQTHCLIHKLQVTDISLFKHLVYSAEKQTFNILELFSTEMNITICKRFTFTSDLYPPRLTNQLLQILLYGCSTYRQRLPCIQQHLHLTNMVLSYIKA